MLHKNTSQCKILMVPEEGWFDQSKYGAPYNYHPTLRLFLFLYSSIKETLKRSRKKYPHSANEGQDETDVKATD